MMSGEESRAGEITAGLRWSLSLIRTGYRPGLMYDIQYYVLCGLMPPAFMHYVCLLDRWCVCVCVTYRACAFVWHVCSVCMSLPCFALSQFTLFIACGYHCFCIGTKMHHVLNISLTSIHPIQLPHPWMQWLWPYQWEILTTQKVGQIKNPPSVCPSSLSVCPPHPLCHAAPRFVEEKHVSLF